MAASVVASGTGAFSATGPTVSATWTPLADDILIAWVSTSNTAAISTIPSSWSDVGPGLITPGDTTCYLTALRHNVTAGEESASTTSWSLSGLFAASETGEWMLAVVRGADPATPIDATGSWTQAGTTSPHTLAGLAGADLSTDSLVLSGIIADGPTVTYTDPSGWTALSSGAGTNTGRWFGYRTALTVAGTDVAATTITPSLGDEGLSITVAVAVAPTSSITGTAATTAPAATAAGSGTLTTAGAATTAAPAATATAAATLTATATGAATAAAATASSVGTLTITGTAAVTAPSAQGSASGAVGSTISGAGAVMAPAVGASGAATLTITGAAAVTHPAPVVAGVGTLAVTAAGAVAAPPATVAATGTVTGGAIDTPLPSTPAHERTLPVPAEVRTLGVPHEDRSLTVAYESRTLPCR